MLPNPFEDCRVTQMSPADVAIWGSKISYATHRHQSRGTLVVGLGAIAHLGAGINLPGARPWHVYLFSRQVAGSTACPGTRFPDSLSWAFTNKSLSQMSRMCQLFWQNSLGTFVLSFLIFLGKNERRAGRQAKEWLKKCYMKVHRFEIQTDQDFSRGSAPHSLFDLREMA